jgi:hypothetical protein
MSGDVAVGPVGEDRLEAVAVVVGEGQLRARVRALAPDDHPRTFGPAREIKVLGDLGDVAVWPLRSVLIDRANPAVIRDLQDPLADGLGQVIADREADGAVAAPVQQLVAGPGRVDAQQDLDALDVLDRDLLDRLLGHGDLIDRGVRAGVARSQLSGQRLAGLIGVGQHRMKAEAALEGPRRALLVGMAGQQRGIQIDVEPGAPPSFQARARARA